MDRQTSVLTCASCPPPHDTHCIVGTAVLTWSHAPPPPQHKVYSRYINISISTYLGLMPLPFSHFSVTNTIHSLAKLTSLLLSFCLVSPVTRRVTSLRYYKQKKRFPCTKCYIITGTVICYAFMQKELSAKNQSKKYQVREVANSQ